MPGTKAGGKQAAATNKAKFGENFYREIGKIGGQAGHTGGFYANRELARIAGAKGGRKSRRGVGTKINVRVVKTLPSATTKRWTFARLWRHNEA